MLSEGLLSHAREMDCFCDWASSLGQEFSLNGMRRGGKGGGEHLSNLCVRLGVTGSRSLTLFLAGSSVLTNGKPGRGRAVKWRVHEFTLKGELCIVCSYAPYHIIR